MATRGIRSAPVRRGGRGAKAYLEQLRRLGASEREIQEAQDASTRRVKVRIVTNGKYASG